MSGHPHHPWLLAERGDPTITNRTPPRDAWDCLEGIWGVEGDRGCWGGVGRPGRWGYGRVMGDLWWDGEMEGHGGIWGEMWRFGRWRHWD